MTDSVRFGSIRFFRTKPVQTSLARFFSGFFGFGSVQFFGFLLIKPKPNRTDWFFQNFNRFNRFFLRFGFFSYFFSGLIGFSFFFLPLKRIHETPPNIYITEKLSIIAIIFLSLVSFISSPNLK